MDNQETGKTEAREDNITTVVKVKNDKGIENLANAFKVSAGNNFSGVVTKTGKVYTFGINEYGTLGINSNESDGGIEESWYGILKADIVNIEGVSAGSTHIVAHSYNGNVYSWGQGSYGELGNGKNFDYYEAQLVGKNIVQANTYGLVLEKEDTFDIDAWTNYFNLLYDKESEIDFEIVDNDIATLNSITGELIAKKEGRTTVIAKEIGTDNIAVIPLRVLENSKIEPMVETAGSHTIMLKTNGRVWTYGINGNDITDEPVQVTFPEGIKIKQIATGEKHSLALDTNGNVWAWGGNEYTQLGSAAFAEYTNPVKINELTGITKIACGAYSSYAIGENGEIFSFGANSNGEGGTGSYTNKISVTKAKNITDAIDIKAGKNHTLVLRSTGEVLGTGSNIYGELGLNDLSIRKIKEFTEIPALKNIVMIDAGNTHNMALGLDGSVYTWGSNIYKELGLNEIQTSVGEPKKVPNLSNIRYITAGKSYSMALSKDRELFGVGLNTLGELGNSTNTNVSTFEKINTENFMQVSVGNTYSVAVKPDGTVWRYRRLCTRK